MENNFWNEYLKLKFSSSQFTEVTDDMPISLRFKHKPTGTSFIFYWGPQGELVDVQYYNDNTDGWSGESGSFEQTDKKVCEFLDVFLNPAFETGWVSKDTYLFGVHWKSKVYFNPEMKGQPFHYYSSRLGCGSIIFFPLFSILAPLIGKTKTIHIEPVQKYSDKGNN